MRDKVRVTVRGTVRDKDRDEDRGKCKKSFPNLQIKLVYAQFNNKQPYR